MKYQWLDEFLLSKKGVRKDFKVEWSWTRYLVGNKMFAAICEDKDSNNIITLKLNPSDGEFLRNQFDDIKQGYYMNKVHWNSVNLEGSVSDELLKDMVNKSYELVLKGLTKKKQKEIEAL